MMTIIIMKRGLECLEPHHTAIAVPAFHQSCPSRPFPCFSSILPALHTHARLPHVPSMHLSGSLGSCICPANVPDSIIYLSDGADGKNWGGNVCRKKD